MNKILIECGGGLGNRLGGLVSGLQVAEQCNLHPIVNWARHTTCDCDFDELFDTKTFYAKNIKITKDTNPDLSSYDVVRPSKWLIETNNNTVFHDKRTLQNIKNLNNSIYYYSNSIPIYLNGQNTIKKLLEFIPRKEILKKVKKFVSYNNINNSVKGLHIRKTDLNLVDENKYIPIVRSNTNTRFFICSDSKEAEDKFQPYSNAIIKEKSFYVKKLFDNSAWRFKKGIDNDGNARKYNVNRSSDSVVEALVDMLILSHTDIEDTSRHSSFLRFSKYYKTLLSDVMKND